MQASDGDESHLPASAYISPAIKRMLPWSQEDIRQLPLKDVDAGWSEETAEDAEDASNEDNSSNTESESSEDWSSSSSSVFLNRQSALSMFKRSQPLIRTRGVEKQGIVCECCWHSCSLPELAQYCTGPAPPTTRTTLVTPTTRVTRAAKRLRKGKGGSGRVLQGGQGGKKTTKPFLFPTPSPQKQPRKNPHVQASTPASVLPLPLS